MLHVVNKLCTNPVLIALIKTVFQVNLYTIDVFNTTALISAQLTLLTLGQSIRQKIFKVFLEFTFIDTAQLQYA